MKQQIFIYLIEDSFQDQFKQYINTNVLIFNLIEYNNFILYRINK